MHLSDDLIAELSDEPKKEAAMRSTEELIAELRDSATAYGPVEGAIYSEAADSLAELEAKVAALSAPPTEGEVERAARGICLAWGYNWDGPEDDDQTAPDQTDWNDERPSKEMYREAAGMALTAAHAARMERIEKGGENARTGSL
jgi:hypothetical protein